ncbi:MAG: hypothetical protein CMO26_04860 [Thiotrichales bacterium]|mgnify:CR=1 FL=1|nr:hypothetical protein [Thiotrichales bacterium]
MQQPVFGSASFDSLQYHFFCGDLFFAVRLQRCPSLDHSSAWLVDGSVRELVNSNERILQGERSFLDVQTSAMSWTVPEGTGRIEVRSPTGTPALQIEFTPVTEIVWDFPTGSHLPDQPVIHQPDLECRVTYEGATHAGIGYCKRAYMEPPRYMGYVFIHGISDDGRTKLWTADAGWGKSKYDYFKLLGPDGTVQASERSDSYQQWDAAYAFIDGRKVAVHIEEIGRWETQLVSGRMDSLFGNRYCHMRVTDGERSFTGKAYKEYWLGTVG